jgi:hypothetical protein
MAEQRISYASLVASLDHRAQVEDDEPDVVRVDGARFLIGEAVLSHGRRLKDHETHDEWWKSAAYRALAAKAKTHIPENSHVTVCIAAQTFSTETVSRVREVVEPLLDAKTVDVLAQGTAAAIGYFLQNGRQPEAGETTGVIDVGMRTTELIGLDGRRPVFARTAGLGIGLSLTWERLAATVGQALDREVDPREVSLAVRKARALRSRGRLFSLEMLLPLVSKETESFAHELIVEINRIWPPEFPETVLLTGGGAYWLADELRAWRSDLIVLPEPEWSNALGCFLYARSRLGLSTIWPIPDEHGPDLSQDSETRQEDQP